MKAPERDEILTEVATDIRWIKKQNEDNNIWLQKSLDKIDVHLALLNDNVAKNKTIATVNKSNIYRLWWFIGIIILSIIGITVKVAIF